MIYYLTINVFLNEYRLCAARAIYIDGKTTNYGAFNWSRRKMTIDRDDFLFLLITSIPCTISWPPITRFYRAKNE